jgi:hypothetical protein
VKRIAFIAPACPVSDKWCCLEDDDDDIGGGAAVATVNKVGESSFCSDTEAL